MAKKKAAKKTSAKSAKKSTAKKAAGSSTTSGAVCKSNDVILKVIFVVLGVAVVIAAFAVGHMTATGSTTGPSPVPGAGSGEVTLIEYGDFRCGFCQRFYNEAYQDIMRVYGDRINFEYRHFPVVGGELEAQAAECARDQGAFWEYHDRIFETGQFGEAALKGHAQALGLNTQQFNECLDSGVKASVVAEHAAEARALGISGTPSFSLNGEIIVGAQPFSVFQQAIDAALAGGSGQAAPSPSPSPQPTPAPQPVGEPSLEGANTLGNPDAPVVMVEYSSYTCPFCGRHHTETWPSIRQNFVDNDQVLFVYKHFPRNDQDILAANAAECAGEQGAFFEMNDMIYANQATISEANLRSWGHSVVSDNNAFDTCFDERRYTDKANADRQEAMSFGVQGTPGFIINGELVSGAQPYNVFEQAINRALN